MIDPEQLSPEEKEFLEFADFHDVPSATDADTLLRACADIITHLYRFLTDINEAMNCDPYAKALMAGSSFLRIPDIIHVGHKFPKVHQTPWLEKRLGEAISRRRQFLHYCEKHHEFREPVTASLTIQGLSDIAKIENRALLDRRRNVDATVGSLQPKPANSGLASENSGIVIPDSFSSGVPSEDGQSSEEDTSSVGSTAGMDSQTRLTVPPMPEDARIGRPCICPYCCIVQEFEHEHTWRQVEAPSPHF